MKYILHVWMSRVTRKEWVMSHIWISMSRTFLSRVIHVNELYFIQAWVVSHVRNESCHTYDPYVTYIFESWHTFQWDILHVWMSRVTRKEWVLSNIWISMSHAFSSRVTHLNEVYGILWVVSHVRNESRPTFESVTPHKYYSRVTHVNEVYGI